MNKIEFRVEDKRTEEQAESSCSVIILAETLPGERGIHRDNCDGGAVARSTEIYFGRGESSADMARLAVSQPFSVVIYNGRIGDRGAYSRMPLDVTRVLVEAVWFQSLLEGCADEKD